MKKLIVLVVLVAVAWYFRGPIGEMLGGAQGIKPRMQTKMDMEGYEERLVEYIEREGRPPGNLEGWLDENFTPKGPDQPSSRDRYGMLYQVNRDSERGGYVLRSCGPDRNCFTEDDILVELEG